MCSFDGFWCGWVQNFGANATTYIIPAILFPVHQRGTCHGISAAAGKLGAILGAQTIVFLQVSDTKFNGVKFH